VFDVTRLVAKAPILRLRSAVGAVLAGLLVASVLLAGALSGSSWHCQAHQAGQAADSHQCVLCLFAHGQVVAADVAPIRAGFVAGWIGPAAAVEVSPGTPTDCRLSQSRAPPACLS